MTVDRRGRIRSQIAAIATLAIVTGCVTTTGRAGSPRWLAEHRGDHATVTIDTPGGLAELHDIRIVSISPTEVQLQSNGGEVVPVENLRAISVSDRGYAILAGAGIGLAVGLALLAPIVLKGPAPDCEELCFSRGEALEIFGPMLAGGGTLWGAVIGLLVGHTDVLTF